MNMLIITAFKTRYRNMRDSVIVSACLQKFYGFITCVFLYIIPKSSFYNIYFTFNFYLVIRRHV